MREARTLSPAQGKLDASEVLGLASGLEEEGTLAGIGGKTCFDRRLGRVHHAVRYAVKRNMPRRLLGHVVLDRLAELR